MKKTAFFLAALLGVNFSSIAATPLNPDSTRLALNVLKQRQEQLLKKLSVPGEDKVATLENMLDLGLWKEAEGVINANLQPDAAYLLLHAKVLILHNDFKQAESLVDRVLRGKAEREKAMWLKAFLKMQAWRLPEAALLCEQELKKNYSVNLELLLGRVKLLQKDYKTALYIAQSLIKANPDLAGAYQLEADVYFWDQHPDLAEAPLKKSLEIDPFNADARFSYGYAIWRRIDATQLNAMAAQWELALAVNPLHFQTNWHWGNGHTNLTYADYAEKDDDDVRQALEPADAQVRLNKVQDAIAITRKVEKQFPASVLPLMHRASIYYIAFDLDRKLRLDSAENLFRKILARKSHYGPAHNGLSAVIKSKRIPYLDAYDSISKNLSDTHIADLESFKKVFPDVGYYPGNMVKAMAWNQLYTAVVYFPFLSREGDTFRIPPLHQDLAITMKSPSFRYMTTFDNRQWMDIRGVGSGAAAIEYVERGAFLERNVILHEYVHLFHQRVLTDAEKRKIRALYYQAMKEKRTLDYYSQNNEHEYFAQTYPAYFEPVKVHPLDFKSMNTTADLKSKDPDMYNFIDHLVKKEQAYLNGDKKAMASNWAEVYLNLSEAVSQHDKGLAYRYLDTALVFDQHYLPVYLGYAQLKMSQRDFKAADEWLGKAAKLDGTYAPVYVAHAGLAAARFTSGALSKEEAVKLQAENLNKAFRLENDYQELAQINNQLREMYKQNGLIAAAIQVAADYGKNGATVSTYLRDRRDDALAFAAVLKSGLGYPEPVKLLEDLVAQKPQNFEYRNFYADALVKQKQYPQAINTLKAAQRILAASGNARADYNLRIAEFYMLSGKKDSADLYLEPFISGKTGVRAADKLRYIRLLIASDHLKGAEKNFAELVAEGNSFYLSEYEYTKGKLLEAGKKFVESSVAYEKAISANPYNYDAYDALKRRYTADGTLEKWKVFQSRLDKIEVKPGPVYHNLK